MKYLNFHLLITFLFSLFSNFLSAYNKPYIINFSKNEYGADNKNWSITQDEKGIMYFGNDIGLLEFDGIGWNLNTIDNKHTIRSVAALSHNTIFTGSYEEFGRWDRDISGQLEYTSLSAGIDKRLFKNDDFWKIWATDKLVYFQSFNSIFIYDYETVRQIPKKKPILFLTKVRDEYWVQEIGGSLCRLVGEKIVKIDDNNLFAGTEVRVILPYSTSEYLIGTSTKGIYIYDGKSFRVWNADLSNKFSGIDLNCGVLTSRNTYVFGTILNGIYEVDIKGNILNHSSIENMLQNNTVLSLFEDNRGNVWAGLDRGLSYIQYLPKMSCYIDPRGNVGSAYTAVLWRGYFFLGTNQGVFYTNKVNLDKSDLFSNMKLIEGTQGQVWSLSIINNRLFCCHNRGFKEIHEDLSVSDPFGITTGVSSLTEAKIKNREILLFSTYGSVRLIDEATDEKYVLDKVKEPIMLTDVDHLENVWLQQYNKGVYRSRLSDNLKNIETYTYFGGDKSNLPSQLKIFKTGGRVEFLGDDKFFLYDDISDSIVPNDLLNNCFKYIKNIKRIIPIQGDTFWALTGSSIYKFMYDGYTAKITESYDITSRNLSLVNVYENVSILNDSLNVVCLDNGFLLYNNKLPNQNIIKSLDIPSIGSIQMINEDGDIQYQNVLEEASIQHNYNTVRFKFSAKNTLAANYSFQYFLKGVDKDWSSSAKINEVAYPRLPKGKYTFMLRTTDSLGNTSDVVAYEFEILSPWYQSAWAYFLYIVLVMFVLVIIRLFQQKKYHRRLLNRAKAREERHLRQKNEELELAVEEKNAELFTQTSFVIQRNELLFKIKEELESYYRKQNNKNFAPSFNKINALLSENIDTDEDWKMFLINFEQKHTNFFKKIKEIYPQLTANDLKLCACLRLNLGSKDIASLMNISVRAVENSRSRLRKKLNIPTSESLNEFFIQF